MRSIIAGVLGGVSGGVMVLVATVGLGTGREHTAWPDSYVRGGIDESIAGIAAMVPGDSTTDAGPSASLAHLPSGHTTEVAVHTITSARSDEVTGEEFGPPSPPTLSLFTSAVIDAPAIHAPQPSPVRSPALPSAAGLSMEHPVADRTPKTELAPLRSAVIETPIAGDGILDVPQAPVQTNPADGSAVVKGPEHAQPTASPPPGRVFRLNVPKDLPKVDLGFSPTIEPIAVSGAAMANGSMRARVPSPAASTAHPARVAADGPTRAPVTSARPVSRSANAPPVHSDEEVKAQDPNESAQESLQRASDAVKRLSRRLAGRFGR